MADINKIQRSKDRIVEILNYLVNASHSDKETRTVINNLKLSIQIIDNKMDEFKGRCQFGNEFTNRRSTW